MKRDRDQPKREEEAAIGEGFRGAERSNDDSEAPSSKNVDPLQASEEIRSRRDRMEH